MKLNKPPRTKEQNALDEYVGFLLTDLSNVTPIHRKPIAKTNKFDSNSESKIKENAEVDESCDPSVLFSVETKIKSSSLSSELVKAKNKSKESIRKKNSKANDEKTDVASFIANTVKVSETESMKKGDSEDKKESTEKKGKIEDVTRSKEFIVESETEELEKWHAILNKEKEKEESLLSNENKNLTKFISPKFENEELHIRPAVYETELPLKEPDERLLKVEKLLARISLATQKNKDVAPNLAVETEVLSNNKISKETAEATFLERNIAKTKDLLPEVFQTLIFNVGKLPLAVPLLKLGGIVPMNEKIDVTPLVGTPHWFLGIMPHCKGNLMVVDTQRYLMPEQVKEENNEYKYLIILDNSNWALACHDVGDAKKLTLDDIRWSEKSSKRPWFGGMVVDYMSALIEVDELINMLADNISE